MNRCQDVEYLRNDECSEGDGDDSDKRLLEHHKTHHHNDDSLVD